MTNIQKTKRTPDHSLPVLELYCLYMDMHNVHFQRIRDILIFDDALYKFTVHFTYFT